MTETCIFCSQPFADWQKRNTTKINKKRRGPIHTRCIKRQQAAMKREQWSYAHPMRG